MGYWQHIDIEGKKIGYARVSTEDQILDMQIDALTGAGCDPIETDHGISGGVEALRPGLHKALSVLEPGDAFIVFKLDRLGRSVLHLSDLLTRFNKDGIHFVSLSEGINTTTPGGKLVYHIIAAVAEFQRDLIRENTVCGLEAARARGAQLGRPLALNEYQIVEAHRALEQDRASMQAVADRCGVSEITLRRALARMGLSISPECS